jgi:outer membrane protein OmpA-like peptidoglycan-associated protein
MVRKLSLFGFFIASLIHIGSAQESSSTMAPYRSFSPADQWELGIHLGTPFISGDNDIKLGFGGGLHVRKSFDHLFSFRGTVNYLRAGSEYDARTSTTLDWISGSGQIVMAVNNFRFNKPNRKLLLNVFGGPGIASISTSVKEGAIPDFVAEDEVSSKLISHIEFGGNLSYRVSPKMNVSLQYTVFTPFGKTSDLLDVNPNRTRNVTTYRDNLHYPSLTLNFNLGGKTKDGVAKAEPLYWSNPLAGVSDAISALEARPIYDPTDTDKDGIIDAIDDEDNSPSGARVDSRGVSLDSDGDKVPDYKDKEPYTAPAYVNNVDANGVGRAPKAITEEDVNRIVDAKIAAIKLPEPPKGISNWFLPMVNFADNRYDLSYSEYEKLYQVASVLKQNPDIKVVAIGHTDKRASERYNNVLSYNRAKAAVEFLAAQHGISRDRLMINWSGEGSNLIPADGSNRANRRVEFRVAGKDDKEMGRPEGPEAGKGRFKGNTGTGY